MEGCTISPAVDRMYHYLELSHLELLFDDPSAASTAAPPGIVLAALPAVELHQCKMRSALIVTYCHVKGILQSTYL